MSCLLAIDVGNTNTVLGVFVDGALIADWRLETNERRTDDEYALLLRALLALPSGSRMRGRVPGDTPRITIDASLLTHGIISSVVPPAVPALIRFFERHLGIAALVVGPGIKTGMPILYEDPRQVGADRIVNAVAAYERFQQGCIVVDFGTATTWDVVTPAGQYLGGVIAPGVAISSEALYQHASKLPRVHISRPARVVGRNTEASMQAGLLYGYAGMVDGVVERIRGEVTWPARCIATGGLAPLIAAESHTIEATDELLTLRGLRILFERNASADPANQP